MIVLSNKLARLAEQVNGAIKKAGSALVNNCFGKCVTAFWRHTRGDEGRF